MRYYWDTIDACVAPCENLGNFLRTLRAKTALGVAQAPYDQERQARDKSEKQPEMHPGQQRVVAPIVEMRDAAFLRAEIAYRRRQIDGPHAAPAQTHDSLYIEIETPHPKLSAH